MNRKQRTRYLLAVYLIVVFVAVILGLIAFSCGNDTWQSMLLNLSTELLGVAFIFFLINRVFLIEEWGISDRVEKLANRLEQRTRFLFGQDHGETDKIERLLANSSKICLLGQTLVNFLRTFRVALAEQVRNGAFLQIVIIDPKSQAANLMRANSVTSQYERDIASSLDYIKQIIQQSQDGGRGKIEVGFINWTPSCSMIIIDPDEPGGYLGVGIYTPRYGSHPDTGAKFVLTRQIDEYWYKTFIEHYEQYWSQAEVVDLLKYIEQTEAAAS